MSKITEKVIIWKTKDKRSSSRPSASVSNNLMFLQDTYTVVVDGQNVPMQLMDAFRTGQIRPNTPIAWTYAEDDGFGFSNGQVNLINKHPAFEKNELKNLIAETGFGAPSPYTDRWFELTYPQEEAEKIKQVYGCPNATDGSRVDCFD